MPLDMMELGTQSDGTTEPGYAGQSGVADIQPHDPLVSLGLVDLKSGSAVPTDDWQPVQPTQPAQPQTQTQQPQPTAQPGQNPPAQPAQPYQPAIDPSAGQQLQQHVATLRAMAADAYANAVTQGAHPQQAQTMIGARLEAEIAKAESHTVRAAAAPAVKSQVATIVAQRFGNGAVRPEELVNYDSPQAMETAAQQLAAARRQQSFNQRRQSGADRVEGSSSPGGLAPAIASLSPEKKIELGIRRGQFT